MSFNKLTAAAAMLLLAGCSSLPLPSLFPEKDEPVVEPEVSEVELPEGEVAEPIDPRFILPGPDTNPYLVAPSEEVPLTAQQWFGEAVGYMQDARWPEAERVLLQLTENYPGLSGPYLNLGIVYRQQNRVEDAAAAFDRAIVVNPLNLEAYNQIALIKREQGDFAAAENYYLSALDQWPKHPASRKNLGILYDLYMGKWQDALTQFEIYQYLQGEEPDRQVAGWIIDIQRRLQERLSVGAQP